MDKYQLLTKAKEQLYDQSLMDAEDDNILYALNREFDEVHTHSKLIFHLLSTPSKKDKSDSFLMAFIRQIGVPKQFWNNDRWTIYRERSFDDGRIDFVLESSQYVAAIEMKLGAGDGSHQLERYDRFCKSRNKEYNMFYLALDGREPSEQSMGELDKARLRCISFEKHIIEWLDECLKYTKQGGYKHSFIMQYMAAVKQITGKGTVFGMSELINDSESAFAVIELHKELQNTMADTMLDFFDKLIKYVSEKTKLVCVPYNIDIDEYYFGGKKTRPGFYVVLDEISIGTMVYRFFACVEVEENLFWGFGFDRVKKNGDEEGVDFDEMRKKDIVFYTKCTEKAESLHIRDFKKENGLWWAYIENTKGEKLNFKRWSSSVVELIDDMDIQVEYIGDYVAEKIVKAK